MRSEYSEHAESIGHTESTGHAGSAGNMESAGHTESAEHAGSTGNTGSAEHTGSAESHMADFTDTEQIQKAIEKIADDETSDLAKLSEIPALLEENLKEHLDDSPAEDFAAPLPPDAPVSKWFFTFMCMNIPIVGWIYLFYLAFSKKVTNRRSFARAYLFYKLVFLLVGILILGILVYIGMDLLDQLLAYMEML